MNASIILRRTCFATLTRPNLGRTVAAPAQRSLFSTGKQKQNLSSLAARTTTTTTWDDDDEHDDDSKHCATCTCASLLVQQPCGHIDSTPLPPPLPEPQYSVYKRVLPSSLIALDSKLGRQYLMECLSSSSAESYWALSQHFTNQSDPAYCGITSLITVLNSMGVDPQVRWRGGWRFYGNEDTLLDRCCISKERVQRIGIDMEDFSRLATCQGLRVSLHRAAAAAAATASPKHHNNGPVADFRNSVQAATSSPSTSIVVVSFGRSHLGQTGDGHFSPIAAYHAGSDSILVMDVARFKYPCYWVSVTDMYNSMCTVDITTHQSRGWFVLSPPERSASYDPSVSTERRRPVTIVRSTGDACPVGGIKVEYCSVNEKNKRMRVKEGQQR